jgi:F-type H+-transporting ATPase subunit b
MRTASLVALAALINSSVLVAQEHAPAAPASPTDIRLNVMFYVLLIFLIFSWILKKFAMGPIVAAVESREKALEEAIEGAKNDRAAAAALLTEQQKQITAARDEAQRLIAEARGTAEKMRHDMVEQTRRDQQDVLQRARNEIEREKERAVAELRREAVDLAIAGASRVIEQNLDSAANRKLVESYLGGLGNARVSQ